jgi:hypothetical protein
MRGLESGTQSCSLLCIVGIGPNPLRHQAPLLTFDGTLIDDMSFGTLTAQVLSVSNLPVRSADNPTMLEHSDRADANISSTSDETCDLIVGAAQQVISDQTVAIICTNVSWRLERVRHF